jgi:hypothetical protein
MAPLIIIGRLVFPSEAAVEEWKAMRLDTSGFEWPEDFPLFRGESPRELATVSDVLGALERAEAPSFFELEPGELRAFLMPDATDRFHQDLATALRQSERVGAKGGVHFFVMGAGVVLHVPVNEEPHHHHHHDDDHEHDHDHELHVHGAEWGPANAAFHDDWVARRFLLVMEFVQAVDENPRLSRREWLEKEAELGLRPLAQAPEHQELLDLLVKKGSEAVFAVLGGITTREDKELSELYPTPEAVRDALRSGAPAARAAAIEILAKLDPAAAMERAPRFLEDVSPHAQRHAVRALGIVGTDDAFRALLALDSAELGKRSQFAALAVVDAIRDSRAKNADALLLAELESPPFRADSWKGLDRVTQAEERAKLAERAGHVLSLVASRRLVSAEGQLFHLFDRHPAEEVRQAAARSLGELDGPQLKARDQEVGFALMGMGKALNQDDARRAELLGVDTKDESLGIKRYDDLDLPRLQKLLTERFADPNTTQNDSPSIGQFFELLSSHPELKLAGYSVPISRHDYRISVDSVYVNIDEVPVDRREEVEAIFEELAQTATNTDPDGATHRCWWT